MRCFTAPAMISRRWSSETPLRKPSRLAAPMSYIETVAIAFMRGSIDAALSAKDPLPQMPRTPMRSAFTSPRVDRKSVAALKASA